MNFRTYGPFELQAIAAGEIDKLFLEIKKVDEGLQYAIGVYIVAAKGSDGCLTPVYVGQTENEFGRRFRDELDAEKFDKSVPQNGSLKLFLIALITTSGKLQKVENELDSSSIDRLELALIGSCLSKNPSLQNKQLRNIQERTINASMHVPGYLNSSVEDEDYDEAARELAEML